MAIAEERKQASDNSSVSLDSDHDSDLKLSDNSDL